MNWKSTEREYGTAAIALHWLAVLLLIAVYCTMEFKGIYPKKSPGREAMALWHYMLGLSVFALVWVRLFVRMAGADPLKDVHETGATVGYFLIGLHALAALFHHYVKRDNTLRLMLPQRGVKRY